MRTRTQHLSTIPNKTALSETGLPGVIKAFHREFLHVGIFSVVINMLMLVPTIYMLQVFDRVLLSQNLTTLTVVSLMTLFLFLIMGLSEWARSVTLVHTSVRLDQALSERVFKASFLSYLHPTETTRSKAFSDLTVLRQFLTGNGVFVLFDLPWIFIYLFVLFVLHPLLGYWALAFAVVQLCVAALGHRWSKSAQEKLDEAKFESQGFLQSKLRNIETLSAMGMLGNLFKRWRAKQNDALLLSGKAQQTAARVNGLSKFLRHAQQTMSLAVGAWLVIHGEITAGAMIAANALMSRALAPIDMLSALWPQILSCRMSYARLAALLSSKPLERDKTWVNTPQGPWQARGLTVRIADRDQLLLQDIHIDLQPSSLTVVMGPSGSGKSTLARAMLGIWPRLEGRVTLDGKNILDYTRESLGPHIGYLPQDIELFDGTIAQNIARVGVVDSNRVIEAAQAADLHQMILLMPQGYDTQVGHGGEFLSGGQRQRIGLARALYGQPTLVVLDEPNANLDSDGERALMAALQALRQRGCIVLVVAHRGAMVEAADQVLLLRDGQLFARGTPQEVMAALQASPNTTTATSSAAQA